MYATLQLVWRTAVPCAVATQGTCTAMTRTMSDTEITALLQRIGQQDHAALTQLHTQVAPCLLGLALRVVRRRETAEDVVQEAFLSIWRSAVDYRPALSPPMAWMALVVRSRAIESLRRRTADRAHLTDAFDDSLADTMACEKPDPCEAAASHEDALALRYCMTLLDIRQRKLLTQAYLQDRTHTEIAADLAMPLGTVKTVIRRGLQRLRETMTGDDRRAPMSLRQRGEQLANRAAFTTSA